MGKLCKDPEDEQRQSGHDDVADEAFDNRAELDGASEKNTAAERRQARADDDGQNEGAHDADDGLQHDFGSHIGRGQRVVGVDLSGLADHGEERGEALALRIGDALDVGALK